MAKSNYPSGPDEIAKTINESVMADPFSDELPPMVGSDESAQTDTIMVDDLIARLNEIRAAEGNVPISIKDLLA
jgi:hypothetical protein